MKIDLSEYRWIIEEPLGREEAYKLVIMLQFVGLREQLKYNADSYEQAWFAWYSNGGFIRVKSRDHLGMSTRTPITYKELIENIKRTICQSQ